MNVAKYGRCGLQRGVLDGAENGKHALHAHTVDPCLDKGNDRFEKAIFGFQEIEKVESEDGLGSEATKPQLFLVVKPG